MRKELYALVDCNSFYAACECVFRPDLRDKPIGILSNNDGCIVALSKELKKLNIPRGTPYYKILHLIEKNKVHIFSSNYALYGSISDRVMKTLSQFTPSLEVYSIDEAFLSLTGISFQNPIAYGKKIKQTIDNHVGVPISVGIAPTKTLAKLANHIAKKYPGYYGVFDITNHPKMNKILRTIEVDKIWGIGFRYAKMLHQNKIFSVYDLVQKPDAWIKQKMSIVGLRTVKELRGISCIEDALEIPPKKNILSSRSFGKPVQKLEALEESVATYCSTAAEKLRRQKSVAGSVMVYLQTNRYKDEPQYANYKSESLTIPTAYTPDLIAAAITALRKIYKKGYHYKKTGVMLSNLSHENNAPLDFFEIAYIDDKKKIIMNAFDTINQKLGSHTILSATCGFNQEWRMKRNFLSPSYTTKWEDLCIVK